MAKIIDARVQEAQDALSDNALAILKVRAMKRIKIAREIEADGGPVLKTTYNILSKKHPPNLENWAYIARALDVPLWVLLIPGLDHHPEILKGEGIRQLVKLVENYMACDETRRLEIDTVASSGAILKRVAKQAR